MNLLPVEPNHGKPRTMTISDVMMTQFVRNDFICDSWQHAAPIYARRIEMKLMTRVKLAQRIKSILSLGQKADKINSGCDVTLYSMTPGTCVQSVDKYSLVGYNFSSLYEEYGRNFITTDISMQFIVGLILYLTWQPVH